MNHCNPPDKVIVLGVHDGHNASVALIVDGVVEFGAQEERLARQKNFYGFPQKSIVSVLAFEDCSPDDIDNVVFTSKYMGLGAHRSEIVASFKTQRKISSIAKQMIVVSKPQ